MADYNFWDLCRFARKEKGYSVKDVSKATGYTHQNISAFERGEMLRVNLDILLWYIRNTRIIELVRYYETKEKDGQNDYISIS